MRPSSIDRLPPELRAAINDLRVDKGYTIEQIIAHLRAIDVTVSKSAIGRHVKKLADVTTRIREARAIAEGIAPTLAGKDDGQVAGLNIELLHAAVLPLLSANEDGEAVQLTPREVESLANALKSTAHAAKINADRVLKIKQETAKDASRAVDKVLKKTAPGLSKETVSEIRRAVLGVAA